MVVSPGTMVAGSKASSAQASPVRLASAALGVMVTGAVVSELPSFSRTTSAGMAMLSTAWARMAMRSVSLVELWPLMIEVEKLRAGCNFHSRPATVGSATSAMRAGALATTSVASSTTPGTSGSGKSRRASAPDMVITTASSAMMRGSTSRESLVLKPFTTTSCPCAAWRSHRQATGNEARRDPLWATGRANGQPPPG